MPVWAVLAACAAPNRVICPTAPDQAQLTKVRFCRNEYLIGANIYALHGMLIHGSPDLISDRAAFSTFPVGNQIADYLRESC